MNAETNHLRALLVSDSTAIAWSMPSLLHRAGFDVDAVATSSLLKHSRFVRHFRQLPSVGMLAQETQRLVRDNTYDWVIATDDNMLAALADLAWHNDARPRHLPVWHEQTRRHICSKIGLSHALKENAVQTPPFAVAADCSEAVSAAGVLGYPVMLKVDRSAGGLGVFECRDDDDIIARGSVFANGPLLVQKKIEGVETDLSAIYLDGMLVHFANSIFERTNLRFGPSVVRTYRSVSGVSQSIFDELAQLGRGLHLGGFVNITCIDAADGSGRYYIEADMRPNVWFDFSRFCGDDAATRIRAWYASGTSLAPVHAGAQAYTVMIPYFLRLRVWELLINRYRVWRFVPWHEPLLVGRLLLSKAVLAFLAPVRQLLRQGFAMR